MRKIFAIILILAGFLLINLETDTTQAYNNTSPKVYVIPVEGEITPAMASFVRDGIKKAEEANADLIILKIDTLGGIVHSAINIKDAIYGTRVRVVSFVKQRAISAGVLISVAAEELYMAPGSTIGAAETIPDTEKAISFWQGEVVAAAQDRGKDPDVIKAMIDRNVEIPELVEKGKLLTLTTVDAERIGFSDGTFNTIEQVIQHEGFETYQVETLKADFKVNVAKFVTSSMVAPVLLSLGFILLLVEIMTAGFGVAGTLSIMAFAVYFGGHMLAGHAGWGSVILFIAGVLLLLIEATMSGFGVAGVGGLVCIFTSIFFASSDPKQAIISMSVAFLLSLIILPVLFKFASGTNLFERLVLTDAEKKELGFVGPADASEYVGKSGVALTTLRPSGSAMIDGKRVDVVSEGDYISKDSQIQVIRVEGMRIIVKKI